MTQAEYRRLKSRLTRRRNAFYDARDRETAKALYNEADQALRQFERDGYPDSWHNWNIAKSDAESYLLRHDR